MFLLQHLTSLPHSGTHHRLFSCSSLPAPAASPDITPSQDPPQIPQSDPDVYVVKRAQRPTSQPVNSIFTFTIEVGVRGLVDALARSVVLEDELPDGLVLDGIQETFVPFENGEAAWLRLAVSCAGAMMGCAVHLLPTVHHWCGICILYHSWGLQLPSLFWLAFPVVLGIRGWCAMHVRPNPAALLLLSPGV